MNEEVMIYDFKKPQRYSADNMRFLSVTSEEFCKSINSFTAYELKKTKLTCKLEKIEQTNYEEFMNTIASDSVIIEHAIQPLVKGLLYQLDKSIALLLIDLTLGGDGILEDYKRELTEIDKELISYITSNLLNKMHMFEGCESREVTNVHSTGAVSKKYPVSESVIISHMKMMDGDREVGKMSFCNPYSSMELVLEQLETKRLFINKNHEYDFEFISAIYNRIHSVSTEIVARLGEASISVDELLDLKVDDVITLDTKIKGEIDLHVGGSRSFKCKPGIIKNKKGVIITDSVKKEG
ncbi:flagellar motor switch protein FliM [Romboutsia sp.]|uniref:flagellar motor switch protein FliM n=1 Tax=Romboutsia sp. TaxID=1965302 RepID=UPI003F2D24AF